MGSSVGTGQANSGRLYSPGRNNHLRRFLTKSIYSLVSLQAYMSSDLAYRFLGSIRVIQEIFPDHERVLNGFRFPRWVIQQRSVKQSSARRMRTADGRAHPPKVSAVAITRRLRAHQLMFNHSHQTHSELLYSLTFDRIFLQQGQQLFLTKRDKLTDS